MFCPASWEFETIVKSQNVNPITGEWETIPRESFNDTVKRARLLELWKRKPTKGRRVREVCEDTETGYICFYTPMSDHRIFYKFRPVKNWKGETIPIEQRAKFPKI